MADVDALDANNVLLSTPTFGEGADEVCTRLLSPSDRDAVAGVTPVRSPDDFLEGLSDRAEAIPPTVGIVDVGGSARAGTPGTPLSAATDGVEVAIEPVESPGNLTDVGVTLTECLDELAGPDPDVALCFGGVATLLQHAGDDAVFQFLQVLRDHVAARDVAAHYHLDRAAVDEQLRARLSVLVDARVRVDGPGDVTVEGG